MTGNNEVGVRRTRREDPPLVTGAARFTDDLTPEGLGHMAIHRSQYAHASIEAVDTAPATARDGVIAVYTAADLRDSPGSQELAINGGIPDQRSPPFPLLADDVVRFTGEAVAVVVADDRYAAADAADRIDVSYDRREAVTDPAVALDDTAPVVHEDYGDNRVFEWDFGDTSAVGEAFRAADRTVQVDLDNQRVLPNPMEPRAALAAADGERLTVRLSTQTPHGIRDRIAQAVGMPSERVRVDAAATGGGFGLKGSSPHAGEPLAAWCATRLDRPVKWIATRSASHRSDHHGRGIQTTAALAFDADATIRGLRVDARFDIGAYCVWGNTPAPNFRGLLSGQYAIPAIGGHLIGMFTNAAPIGPYRGAGRPEAIYVVERLVDRAARELDVDPVKFRRHNLIPEDAFPYETAVGTVYDSGSYAGTLDTALGHLDYAARREEQARLREVDRYIGIGVTCVVENAGTGPGTPELARIEIDGSGQVTAYCGTFDHGQGHQTTFAQVIADELGVPYDSIVIEEGDTDALPDGTGTFGSRSAPVGASALAESARDLRDQLAHAAARHFEAAVDDIVISDGTCFIQGSPDRSIPVREAAAIATSGTLPAAGDGELAAGVTYDPPNNTFPFGTHAAVVEVDPATGELDILDYIAVEDCGVQFNPMIVDGQVHGGVAQGIGQAVFERVVYDENGNLVSGSLQDYVLPKAEHVPAVVTDSTVTPSPHTPTGAKGVGEAGAIAAPPTIVNAAVDALEPLGVEALDMPLTAERVWQAIHDHTQV